MTNQDSLKINLNDSQLKAVKWNEGPLLVLAGPGSGKTTVLTQRIIRLLKESQRERYRILALTFTQNAAHNMRNRIEEELSEERERAYLTTFHSFCADIIRQHGELTGIKPDFSIMTTDLDREELLLEIIRESIDSDYNFKKEDIHFLPKINSFLEQCIEINEEPIPDTDINKAKYLFYNYLSKMRQTGRIDYAGILYFAWQVLGNKQVFKHYNIVYKYICVDEYQDTNLAQFKVLSRLVKSDNPNLFVVADDDQIVYQWNGASPERLNQIIGTYKMKIMQLPENYRCPNQVVAIANKMISYNKNRIESKIPSISLNKSDKKPTVRLEHFENFQDEIKGIADDIKQNKRTSMNTKIMARTRKLLDDTQTILEKNGLASVVYQRKAEFESPPLRFMHSLLRLFVSRADKVQVQRLSAAFYQLEGINVDIHQVIGMTSLTGGDLLKAWVKIALEREELSKSTRIYVNKINFDRGLVEYEELLNRTFSWLDTIENTEDQPNSNTFDNYQSEKIIWNSLVDDIQKSINAELTLSSFLQELDLRDKSASVPKGAYELITIHGAKGLEFEHVYLIGIVDDILPIYNSIKTGARPESLEEERRSCYVAITRTQKTLTMTYSNRYDNWQKQPSRFLSEMGLIVNGK